MLRALCTSIGRTGCESIPPWGLFHCRPHLDRKSTRLNSSHSQISYAVFCLKKKKNTLTVILCCVYALIVQSAPPKSWPVCDTVIVSSTELTACATQMHQTNDTWLSH